MILIRSEKQNDDTKSEIVLRISTLTYSYRHHYQKHRILRHSSQVQPFSDATCDLQHSGHASQKRSKSITRDTATTAKEEDEEEEEEVDEVSREAGGGQRRKRWWRRKRQEELDREMRDEDGENGHSALRPRYTANMAAEGRIGGGQPRRQLMSS